MKLLQTGKPLVIWNFKTKNALNFWQQRAISFITFATSFSSWYSEKYRDIYATKYGMCVCGNIRYKVW